MWAYSFPSIGSTWRPFIEETRRNKEQARGAYRPDALERELLRVGRDASVHVPAVVPHFLANQARGPFHLLPRNPHNNAAGYQLTAEVLAAEIIARRSARN